MSLGGRTARKGRWLISQVPGSPGLVSVTRNGRGILAAVPGEIASRYIRKHRQPGDRTLIEEEDGYRRRA